MNCGNAMDSKVKNVFSQHYIEMEGLVPGSLFLREFSASERIEMYSTFMSSLDWLAKMDKVAFHLGLPQIEKFLYQDCTFPLWLLCDSLEHSLSKLK